MVKNHRINFTKINLFSNVNIWDETNIQKAKTLQKKPPSLYMLEKSSFYFRTEIAILSGRKIHLQKTKGLPFSHAKPCANKNEPVFPTP